MSYTGMSLWLALVVFLCIVAGLDEIQIIIVGFLAILATLDISVDRP